jgi:hypothetical protein
MSAAYWDQWDKDDLDSWQGKETVTDEEDITLEDDIRSLKLEAAFFVPCLEDYGMCARDFM